MFKKQTNKQENHSLQVFSTGKKRTHDPENTHALSERRIRMDPIQPRMGTLHGTTYIPHTYIHVGFVLSF